ncbi:M14 family zinc carboxypeptidase [Candidatus Latescibacterota bacterium]
MSGLFRSVKSHWIILAALIFSAISPGTVYTSETDFFPDGTYDTSIPTPKEVLGFSAGERPAKYDEVVRYFTLLAERSPRVRLFESGTTHENRTLFYLVVSSEDNMARLDEIQDNIGKLADPRRIESDDEAESIIEGNPAVAWMMYSIHGDEFSGTDSSLQVAYQLVAGTDPQTERIRRELITGIDPMAVSASSPRCVNGAGTYLQQMPRAYSIPVWRPGAGPTTTCSI